MDFSEEYKLKHVEKGILPYKNPSTHLERKSTSIGVIMMKTVQGLEEEKLLQQKTDVLEY